MQERFLITIENIGEFLKKPQLRERCVDFRACQLDDESQGYLLTISPIQNTHLETELDDKTGESKVKVRQILSGGLIVYPIDQEADGEKIICETYILTPDQVSLLELGYEEEHQLMVYLASAFLNLPIDKNT